VGDRLRHVVGGILRISITVSRRFGSRQTWPTWARTPAPRTSGRSASTSISRAARGRSEPRSASRKRSERRTSSSRIRGARQPPTRQHSDIFGEVPTPTAFGRVGGDGERDTVDAHHVSRWAGANHICYARGDRAATGRNQPHRRARSRPRQRARHRCVGAAFRRGDRRDYRRRTRGCRVD
jgi:hypothetical protein